MLRVSTIHISRILLEILSSDDAHELLFQTNFWGPIPLIQSLVTSFRAQSILNVSSVAGLAEGPHFGAYSA
jgi:NAD(P)-dependent dehydrogenase (short-subunit alcohol dehydrogenase family)